jgi:hypothetical protein
MRLLLKLPSNAGPVCRARLTYAFRLFCAIYGHQPLLNPQQAASADISISYLPRSSKQQHKRCVQLTSLYTPRPVREPAPAPQRFSDNGETTIVHYGPTGDCSPDWLGEIFEWVSCADEYSVTERDPVGRPLYEATYAGRHHLDVEIPYAAVAMHFLQREICRIAPRAAERPTSPDPSISHLIIPTHDVDYFPVGRAHSIKRLTQNAIISWLLHGRPLLGIHQAKLALYTALGGHDPLDRIPALVEEERKRGFDASYYFLVRHLHKKDASYTLDNAAVMRVIRWLESMGMEVGIHNSYTCLDTLQGLEGECADLHSRSIYPQGGRQHWLRFTLDCLIPSVEYAGLLYDASVGWSERIGFRAGACFAFPPYNFAQERPATFLEMPLVIMDQALQPRQNGSGLQQRTTDLLAISRRLGWGGISLLWHPTAIGGGWLAPEVGRAFWHLADKRNEWNDTWMSGSRFVQLVRQRYVDAGLLPEIDEQMDLSSQEIIGVSPGETVRLFDTSPADQLLI